MTTPTQDTNTSATSIPSEKCFLDRVLKIPRYGFVRDGQLYVPTHREIWSEFFHRLNVFRDRRNWLALFGWTATLSFAIPLAIFFIYFFSWPLFFAGFVYSMVLLGSHGTFWLHRYSTHRAFKFRNGFVRMLCRNLVIRIIPEEIYVISHHVHHRFPEKPGDPYNVHGGWLYCFLADVNHQTLNTELSEKDHQQVCKLMEHTGVHLTTYEQYKKWGSACKPWTAIAHYALNWSFWYGAFYLLGGHALATALFGFAGVWGIGVRTYNYDGHGRGKLRHKEGSDFNKSDLSVNQIWPGYVAGEWHNNHHLFPNGARSGFLWYQLDLPWLLIRSLEKLGLANSVKDYKLKFMNDYYRPFRKSEPNYSSLQVPESQS